MALKHNLNLPPQLQNLHMPNLTRVQKRVAFGVFGLLFLLWMALSFLVDEKEIAKSFADELKVITGYDVTYGEVSVSVIPIPKVTLKMVKLTNDAKASSQNFLVTDSMTVTVNVMKLLSGKLAFQSIAMEKPQFQLEKFADKTNNWGFLYKLGSKNLEKESGVDLIINHGGVTFVNSDSNKVQAVDNFSLVLTMSPSELGVNAGLSIDNKAVNVNGRFAVESFTDIDNFKMTGTTKITEAQNELNYEGAFGRAQGMFTLHGKLASQFTDIKPWLFEVVSDDSQKVITATLPDAIPATFSADVAKDSATMNLTNLAVKGTETQGTGSMKWTVADTDALALDLNFSKLDFGNVVANGEMLFSEGAFNRLFGMFLPQGVSAEVNIRAGQTHFGALDAESFQLSATLDQQELVINQAALNLVGDNHLLLFGILKLSVEGQINFDGNIEVLGKSLSQMVTSLGLVSQSIITDHTGEFRGKATLFLSPNSNTVSEIKFQAGPLLIAGGATIGATKDSDAEITLQADNIKLDGLLAALIPTSPKDLGAIGTGFEDVDRHVDWLSEVQHRIVLNLIMPHYTLSNRSGADARIITALSPNRLDLRKVDMSLDDLQVKGNLSYDQTKRVPNIEGDVYMSYLNIASVLGEKSRISPVPRGNRQEVWNADYFKVNFLKGYDSFVHVTIGNLIHPDFGMTDFSAQFLSKDDQWTVTDLQANIWEGQIKGGFTLDVSSVPGINAQFALANVKADRMMDALIGQPSFRGMLSVGGQIATSGLNMLSWVRNSMGHLSFTGQDFAIKGFDVASLVQTVPLMRSVTDVVNTARVALLKNQSTFNVIDGFFNIEQGVLSTPEVKLRSKHATGTLKGQMELPTWAMDVSIDFALTTLDPANYPVLRIFFKDSIDDPMITFDTRSLEAFIARKKIR